jgi:integrase
LVTEQEQILSNSSAYFNFINSITSQQTKQAYNQNLTRFMKFCNLDSVDNLLKIDMQKSIINYVVSLKNDNISYSTINVLLAPIFHFCEMNDIILNKKKIAKYKPERMRVVNDRSYTDKEIAKILNIADIRMKVIILLMASAGLRAGAIPSLRLRNIDKNKITVYEKTNDEYFTFCTPECRQAIDDYLEYRTRNGENLTPESYLIRQQFNINDIVKKSIKPIQVGSLMTLVKMITIRAGLRQTNHIGKENKKERKDIALTHSFRKFFTTTCINSEVNPEIREMLLGHKIGLASAYYRPTEEKMLAEYQKAANNLTINEENRLNIKVKKLEAEKDKFDLFAMKTAENFRKIEEKLMRLKAGGSDLDKDDLYEALDDFGITPKFAMDRKTGRVILDT